MLLSNTFGFGGHNAFLLVKKYKGIIIFEKLIRQIFSQIKKDGETTMFLKKLCNVFQRKKKYMKK